MRPLATDSEKKWGFIGICQHHIPCIVGIYPEERKKEQILVVDAKIKIDFLPCIASKKISDSIDYVLLANLCTELAQEKKYDLLETFASDILDQCIERFHAVWAWVRIQKPSAIPTASYAYVELEGGQRCEPS